MTRLAAVGALLAVSVAACSADRDAAGRGNDRTGKAGLPVSYVEAPTPWVLVASGDFNGDGTSDALWFDPTTGHMAVWLLRGTDVLERGPEMPGPAGAGWTALGAGDYNYDGMADVLWGNATTNQMAVWLMRGTCLLEAGPAIPGPPGDGWVLTGFDADANADGMADVVWQNPNTRLVSVWLMRGTQVLAVGPEIPSPGAAYPTGASATAGTPSGASAADAGAPDGDAGR